MASTTGPTTVKDQELISFGLVESSSVSSFADFIPSKLKEKDIISQKEKNDFLDTFICHLIFYALFCISLVLHILIDLGFGTFVKKVFIQLIETAKNIFVERKLVFA